MPHQESTVGCRSQQDAQGCTARHSKQTGTQLNSPSRRSHFLPCQLRSQLFLYYFKWGNLGRSQKHLLASRRQKSPALQGWAGSLAWRLAWAVSVCCEDGAEKIESLGQAWEQKKKKKQQTLFSMPRSGDSLPVSHVQSQRGQHHYMSSRSDPLLGAT